MKFITECTKVLALDGDFHNRAYDYIDKLGKCIIIHNNIIKDVKEYTFISDYHKFSDSIDDDLIKNKNLVIVTMSSKQGKIFYEKYKDKYDTIMHSSKTDDELKNNLKDVENNWKCRLLIYTPSVQSGVSFDVPHFDQMYVILSSKSCSSRDVCQMTHRVRQFKNNNVMVYLNNLPYREDAKFYTYDTMVDYVKNAYIKYKSSSDSLYCKMLTYNEVENINKEPLFFVPRYIKYLKDKGSKYCYEKTDKKTKKEQKIIKEIDFDAQGVIDAEDITESTYREYLMNQNKNIATEQQKYAIEKYLYKLHWKVDEINQEFMDLWFRKTYVLYNLKDLILGVDDRKLMSIETNNKYLDYDKAIQEQRIEIIKELITGMGFDLENIGNDLVLNRETFIENMNHCIKNCQIFTKVKNTEILFGIKIRDVKTVKAFTGFVNSVLKNWGLDICFTRKSIRDKETKHINRINNYHLGYYQTIELYL
jgi:hypothetical protein